MEVAAVEIYCTIHTRVQLAQTQEALWASLVVFLCMKKTKLLLVFNSYCSTSCLSVCLLSAAKPNFFGLVWFIELVPDWQVYILFLALCCVRELSKHRDKRLPPCPYRKHSSTSENVSYTRAIKYVRQIDSPSGVFSSTIPFSFWSRGRCPPWPARLRGRSCCTTTGFNEVTIHA